MQHHPPLSTDSRFGLSEHIGTKTRKVPVHTTFSLPTELGHCVYICDSGHICRSKLLVEIEWAKKANNRITAAGKRTTFLFGCSNLIDKRIIGTFPSDWLSDVYRSSYSIQSFLTRSLSVTQRAPTETLSFFTSVFNDPLFYHALWRRPVR